MEATWQPHDTPVALKGNVYVSTYGQTKVHSYLSPPDGLMVNTQIVEGRSNVVIFDGQLHLPYAEEVASYIKRSANRWTGSFCRTGTAITGLDCRS